jgi:hypothetical protein
MHSNQKEVIIHCRQQKHKAEISTLQLVPASTGASVTTTAILKIVFSPHFAGSCQLVGPKTLAQKIEDEPEGL